MSSTTIAPEDTEVEDIMTVKDKLLTGPSKVVMVKKDALLDDVSRVCTLNEAILQGGDGLFHTYLMFVCGFCVMGVITESLGVSYIITSAECELQLTQADKGLVTGAAFLGVVLSSHFWGILSDMWGRRNILLTAATGCFLASFVSCFSVNVPMLIVMRCLVGIFVSANAAIPYAYLGEFHSNKTRAKAVTMSGIFIAFGLMYLPALAWAIIPLGRTYAFTIPLINITFLSWRLFLLLISLINAMVIIGLLFLPESPEFLLTKNRTEESLNSLRRMYKINGKLKDFKLIDLRLVDKSENLSRTVSSNPAVIVWHQTCMLFNKDYLKHTWKVSFMTIAIFLASSGLYLWIVDILNNLIQYRSEPVTTCQAFILAVSAKNQTVTDCLQQDIDTFPFMAALVMSVIFAVSYFVNGLIINKFGKRNLFIFWGAACGLSSLGLIWSNNFYVILFFIVVVLTSGCCGSLIGAIIVDLYPTEIKGMALSFILMTGRLAAALGSNIIGWLLIIDCSAVFYLVGLFLIVSAGVAFLVPKS